MARGREPKAFRLSNMTGGMNTMDEVTKLVQLDSGARLAKTPSEAMLIENFMPLNRGGQRTERGYELYKDTGISEPIRGIYKYYEPDGTEHFMVCVGGTLYELDGSNNLNSVLSVDPDAYIDFETAYGYLVVCDGVNYARTWDGATVANLTTSVAAPTQSRFYLDRLFTFFDFSSFVYHSNVGDIFNGYASNFVKCDTDDGSKITGIEKLFIQGQFDTALIVGKESAVGAIVGDGTVASPFSFVQLNQDAGIAGFRSMRQHNQDVSYLTPKGVSSYQLNQTDVNLAYKALSAKVLDQFLGLDTAALKDSHVVYDWRNTRLRFFVPEQGATYPNIVWNYDTEVGGWYKTRYPEEITASFVDKDGVLWLGTANGELMRCLSSIYSFNGAIIPVTYRTGYIDFGAPNQRKRIIDATVYAQGKGNYGFGISSKLDYGQQAGSSGTITLQGSEYLWGGGVWTADPGEYQWAGTPISINRFIPGGYFKNIQFEFNGNSSESPFDIFSVDFLVEFLDYR